ncbi:MAG: LeuA family protein [Acidobacteriota bacterium]
MPSDLVFDWNRERPGGVPQRRALEFDDETLRDGVQSPSVRIPPVDEQLELVRHMVRAGIGSADVGMPGSGARAAADAESLCRAIVAEQLAIRPNCAARTVAADIEAVLAIQQRIGAPIEIALFLGASPIRCRVEGWSVDDLVRRTESAVALAVRHSAPVVFVTEDTTRSHPDTLRRVLSAAAENGARRLCVADTAGHATPLTVIRVIRFVQRVLGEWGRREIGLDWHGHNDRGLAVANALTAAWAGASRIHATALGVGERVGNPPMEQVIANAALEGWVDRDIRALPGYAACAARILGVPIPFEAPVVGRDAFRTTTGVHAAAIAKARAAEDESLVDLVYSSLPASWLGRAQVVEVGPQSGASNVRLWLADNGFAVGARTVAAILAAAKRSNRPLSDDELLHLAHEAERGRR